MATTTLRGPALALLLSLLLCVPAAAQSELADALRGLGGVRLADDAPRLAGAGGELFRIVDVEVEGDGPEGVRLRLRPVAGPELLLPTPYAELLGDGGLPARLEALLEELKRAGLRDSPVLVRHDPVLGFFADLDARIVRAGLGVLERVSPPAELVEPNLEEAQAAVNALVARRDLPETSREAIRHLVSRLDDPTVEDDEDHVTPEIARRLVMEGWLRRSLGESEAIDVLERAVAAAATRRETATWRGALADGEVVVYARIGDGFGAKGATLRVAGRRRAYRVPMPQPNFIPGTPRLALVVELDPEGEGFDDAGDAVAASVHSRGVELARWTPEGGLKSDLQVWRQAVPEPRASEARTIPPGLLPPHMVLTGLDGERHLLATADGEVRPPDPGDPESVDRFVEAAARSLPDAAHLDLLGEYLFAYVHDSPDPTRPWLLGFEGALGEIHQSVEQTLANTSGGVCRGDCDDLAEVYQAVTRRQGRLSHIMNVPRHNALAWAEEDEDGWWSVFVLQTGPPLMFRSRRLERAIGYAYTSFGAFENFDPDQCPISVRFSGENTRSTWVLGWRIFRDAEYAETMIDVQRDWHFHTFARAVEKMEALVASGDEDVANFRELAGLAERTGQHDLAVRYLREGRERSGDDRLTLTSRIIANLADAGREDEVSAEIDKALERIASLGGNPQRRLPVVFEIAQLVYALDDPSPLRGLVASELLPTIGRQLALISGLLRSGRLDAEAWERDPSLGEIRRLASDYARIALRLVEKAPASERGAPDLVALSSDAEVWASEIAFRDPDLAQAGTATLYALVGEVARAILGDDRLGQLMAGLEAPKGTPPAPESRGVGLAQLRADLPWIAHSPSYWIGLLSELFDRDRKSLDRSELERLLARVEATYASPVIGDLERSRLEDSVRRARFLAALVKGDDDGVREHLRHVRSQNDKRLRDGTADLMGATARFLGEESWSRALTAWDEEVGGKPGYFAIAWEAARMDAPARALAAAELAARRFADDPAFPQELAFMRRLLSEGSTLRR